MRQQQNQSAEASPFDFAGADELIDHNLGAVGKVTELGLPEHQRIGSGCRIAVFEPEHGVFRQHRVDHGKGGRFGAEMLQRNVVALIPLFALLVMQHGMTMTERTSTAVLPRKTHGVACRQKSSVGQVFGHAPVDSEFACSHPASVSNDLGNDRMQFEGFGQRGDHLPQTSKFGHRHAGIDVITQNTACKSSPISAVAVTFGKNVQRQRRTALLESSLHLFAHLFAFFKRNNTGASEFSGIESARTGVFADGAVH